MMTGNCSSMNCSVTGVNLKHFPLSVIAGFAFVLGYDYVVHLWNGTAASIPTNFTLVSQFLTVLVSAFIFTRHFEGKGIGEGIRFGTLLGALMTVLHMTQSVDVSFTLDTITSWLVSGFGLGLGLGIVFSQVYRK